MTKAERITLDRLMAAVLSALLIAMSLCLVTEDYRHLVVLLIPAFFLMCRYAPWYMLGMVPFWVFYAIVTFLTHGSGEESQRWAFTWVWAWTIYPLLRGIWHNMKWAMERKTGQPLHPITKHPKALIAASLGLLAASHYLFKKRSL